MASLGRVVDLVVGRVPGQGEEHLVEARLAIGELAHLDAGVGERGERPVGVAGARRRGERGGIGLEAHCLVERVGEDHLGVGPAPGVAQAHPQAPGADRRLQLAARALGDHLPVVDDRDPIGQLVGLLQVLGREQHGGAGAHQRPHDVPHLVAAARVEPGGRLVEEEHARRGDDARGDVEAAAHAARVLLDETIGRVGQPEGVEEVVGSARGRGSTRSRAGGRAGSGSPDRSAPRRRRPSARSGRRRDELPRPRRRCRGRARGPALRSGSGGWRACGRRWSCRRRWGRARRRRCRRARRGRRRRRPWCRRSASPGRWPRRRAQVLGTSAPR